MVTINRISPRLGEIGQIVHKLLVEAAALPSLRQLQQRHFPGQRLTSARLRVSSTNEAAQVCYGPLSGLEGLGKALHFRFKFTVFHSQRDVFTASTVVGFALSQTASGSDRPSAWLQVAMVELQRAEEVVSFLLVELDQETEGLFEARRLGSGGSVGAGSEGR